MSRGLRLEVFILGQHPLTSDRKPCPNAGVIQRVMTMTMSLIVLFMISWRYLNLPLSWIRSGLGYVVLRDSALSLLTIIGALRIPRLLYVELILIAWALFLILTIIGVIDTSMNGNMVY